MTATTDPFELNTSNAQYSKFIHLSRYSRWRDDLGRRESWEETVDRLISFWESRYPEFSDTLRNEVEPAIYNLEVMPSMRSLMTAGKALDRDEVAGYNCSYLAIDNPKCFDELMYILLCGTGVGYSVERQYVKQLPEVAEEFHETETPIIFSDSKVGWASGFRELISLLYAGKIPKLDFSRIRPAGERLKTFGGRASGPEPLRDLCNFAIQMFKKARGRKLSSLECHDLVCKIAQVVVVGGVRRSACISLSNLSDDRMRGAKSGQWWVDNAQRALANNSYVADERPQFDVFLSEWLSLHESKSGERGIFSRVASKKQAERNGRRDPAYDFGTNPCSEIILRDKQFCNLTEVIVRPTDTPEDLERKVRIATILGTLQASLTNFRYLRKRWKQNTEEEALLGVSMTGIMDHPVLNGYNKEVNMGEILSDLREKSVEVNEEWAKKIGINPAAAITCVKPSGTVSQLTDTASGIHPRFSPYYLRTVRADKKDPLAQFMINQGFYCEVDQMSSDNYVFYFPIKSPDKAITANDMTALEQLDLWKKYQDHWCEHKPSMTCYYSDDEFLGVGQWIWDHFETVSGIAFLPRTDHIYPQAPYQPISKEEYERWVDSMPQNVDWDLFPEYEKEDATSGTQEFACAAGGCEI